MSAINKTEQSQDSQCQYGDLDHRYGKIGISAVAAALCMRGERPTTNKSALTPYDRD